MTCFTHTEYLARLATTLDREPHLRGQLAQYPREVAILVTWSLDAARTPLADLYCPTGQGDPYDPTAMLRSWLLMTLLQVTSPDAWATRLRREPALAALAGFAPGHAPCATAHRDFLTRLADGPYAARVRQDKTLSQQLRGRHAHRLDDATTARRADANGFAAQADQVAAVALAHADQPRDPRALATRLENLLAELGLQPSLAAGLFDAPDAGVVSGDGTILASAASARGYPTCDCPPEARQNHTCDHPREYTSRTAQWCYNSHTGQMVFGDRAYTLSVHVNGHDLPLLTILPGGNESDYTLSLKALDDLLKLIREADLPLTVTTLVGDGHHDAHAIYAYLHEQGIDPVIPLNDRASSHPLEQRPDIACDDDGTPLCPEGCRLRHHQYLTRKHAHYYCCPALRKNKTGAPIFHAEECPRAQNCCPEKVLGYTLYLPEAENRRLLPPIPRDSRRFKQLYNERTSTERQNAVEDHYHLDRSCRNAAYMLIRLTLVNCCKHAVIRWRDQRHTTSAATLCTAALRQVDQATLPD